MGIIIVYLPNMTAVGSMCTDRYLRTMLGTKKAYCYVDEVLFDLMIRCCYMVNFCDTAVPR